MLWEQRSVPPQTLQREETELHVNLSPHDDLKIVLPESLKKTSASDHAKSMLNTHFHS